MMCALAPQTPAENVAQSPLRLLSCTLVEVDQPDAIADFAPIAALQLRHQRRKQPAEYASAGRAALAVDSADLETVQPPR